MTTLSLQLYNFLKSRTFVRIFLLFLLFGFFGFYASRISFEEDISKFLPKDGNNEKINFLYKNIKIADRIIVQFSLEDTLLENQKEELIEVANYFATQIDSLDSNKEYVKELFYQIDQQQIFELTNFLTENIPYFLSEEDYLHFDSIITSDNVRNKLEANKKVLVSPAGMILKKNIISDPLGLSLSVLNRLRSFQINSQYQIFEDHIFSKDGKNLMFFITSANPSSETTQNAQLVAYIDAGVAQTKSQFNNKISISYFGSAPVAVANASQIKIDTYISVSISVVLILIVLFGFFRNVKSLLFIAVPVLFGTVLSLSALYFIKGTISAISIGAGSVIFGIAINYSLHFLIHTKYETNISKAIKELASPMITGSVTTVGAFLSLLLISSEAMRDFGLFAAFALLGTLVFVLVFMPHFIKPQKQKVKAKENAFFSKLTEFRFEKNRKVLLSLVSLTIILFYFSFDVSFESDMHKINFMTTEQREAFKELSQFTSLGKQSMYLVSEGKTLTEALREYEKIKPRVDSLIDKGIVLNSVGLNSFLPSDSLQRIKLNRWNKFWKSRKDTLKQILSKEAQVVGFKESSFIPFLKRLEKEYEIQPVSYFSSLTNNFAKEYIIERENKAMVITILYTLPKNSTQVFESFQTEKSFVFDSSSIAKSLIKTLSTDFNTVLYICSLIVLVFLTISFGRFELSVISFLPMLISWIWILGIMSIFGIKFNIVNVILATFIFGLGDDYTIFIMDGMMNEYAYRKKILASYKKAVVLSAITMFIGIGTLVFAQHPALKSLANVTIVGMFSVVIISFVIPPFLFHAMTYKKGKKRLIPVTFLNLGATIHSFTAFLIGSLFLTVVGFLLIGIRKPNDKLKFKYHQYLNGVARFVVKHLPLVNTQLINEFNEKFEKPGVIICNHQSHLDLMFLMMLNPRLIIATNQWVWNSPFYGRLIKYADYYPVASGMENSTEKLADLVKKGYSIVIFPEGTRSEDGSILRFHKGAFFLAEELNVDIIPVITHGISHVLPKSELMLRKGNVTIKILERIKTSDLSYGKDYRQRAKQLRQVYIKEYNSLSYKNETPTYYRNLVYHNYVYKTATIQKKARLELNRSNNYEKLISILPEKGKILHVNCGIGVFDLLFLLVKKNIQLTAIDSLEENIDIARNCVSVGSNLKFEQKEVSEITLRDFDCIVLTELDEINTLQTLLDSKIPIYMQLDKKNKNYESIKKMNSFTIEEETDFFTFRYL